jgi:hypothetical protein
MGWEDAMRAIEMGVFGYGDQQCEWQCEINQLAIFHCLRRIPEASLRQHVKGRKWLRSRTDPSR